MKPCDATPMPERRKTNRDFWQRACYWRGRITSFTLVLYVIGVVVMSVVTAHEKRTTEQRVVDHKRFIHEAGGRKP